MYTVNTFMFVRVLKLGCSVVKNAI